jgi:hypothetical protein
MGNIESVRWVEYFKTLLNPPVLSGTISYAEPLIEDELLDRDFTFQELQVALSKAKNDKAPGCDGIPYEFFKNAPNSFLLVLLNLYNNVFKAGCVPVSFKKSVIFPLHKKGDLNNVQNYRGLSFINCISKLYTSLLHYRLSEWVNYRGLLIEYQAGFRKGYSTVDNLFNLTSMIKLRLSTKGNKLYSFFIDFSAAFDTIDRNALFYKLSTMGVSTRMLTALRALYDRTEAGVWFQNCVTESFETRTGLRQGCICSPLLFCLFINDMADGLFGGCVFGQTRVNILLYADDVVLIAPTAASLQIMINNLEKYCDLWNLQLNLNKSKILVFRNGGKLKDNDRWVYKGNRIEVVNSYKYLGVELTSKLSWESHINVKSTSSKFAINNIWLRFFGNNKISLDSKFNCFYAVVRSMLCYGCEIWGYKKSEKIESVLRFFIKKLFNLPSNTPNYALYLETGVNSIFIHTLQVNLNYLIRVLSLPNERLPHILANQIIRKKLYWCEEWHRLGHALGVEVDMEGDVGRVQESLVSTLEAVAAAENQANINAALGARYHRWYASLDLVLGDSSYLIDSLPMRAKKWIFKARVEAIFLNYKPWVIQNQNHHCSLCNLEENEDIFHFVSRCPILSNVRKSFLLKNELSLEEFLEYMNGRDWRSLGLYLINAWKVRWDLISEFNF